MNVPIPGVERTTSPCGLIATSSFRMPSRNVSEGSHDRSAATCRFAWALSGARSTRRPHSQLDLSAAKYSQRMRKNGTRSVSQRVAASRSESQRLAAFVAKSCVPPPSRCASACAAPRRRRRATRPPGSTTQLPPAPLDEKEGERRCWRLARAAPSSSASPAPAAASCASWTADAPHPAARRTWRRSEAR